MVDQGQIVAELRRIIGQHGGEPFGPVGEDHIRAAEREIGLEFPLSFRLYLREFGAIGDILDLSIYGLPDTRDTDREDEARSLNVVDNVMRWRTDFWRDRMDPELASYLPHMIDVGTHERGGTWFFLDTSATDEDGEAPVLIHGLRIPVQIFAPSFVEFVRTFSDEAEPFARVVMDPLGSPPAAPDPGPDAEPRSITWLASEPDPDATIVPPNARYLGVDEATGGVFVHASTVGLDLEQQMASMEDGDGFFANPSEQGGFEEPFVAIDYVLAHHPELAEAAQLEDVKRMVLDAFESVQSDDDEE